MPRTTEQAGRDERGTIWRRLAWFVGLWVMGVISVGAVAGILRWLLRA